MSTNFKEIIQKIVNAKAKSGLRSSTIVWDLNVYCSKGHHLSHNTFSKVQTQDSNNKNSSCSRKAKPKDPKLALLCDNAVVEPAKKKDRKNKKKRF